MSETFVVDNPDVMHETMENEVIVLDLDSGAYFSFDGTGALIWALITAGGQNRQSILEDLAKRFGVATAQVESEVNRFLDRLVEERLVRVAESESDWSDDSPDASMAQPALTTYAPPVLNKFTDMQALLLVDPIHEVGDAGWPHRKE